MKFSCSGCGNCCKAEPGEENLGVRVFDFEVRRIEQCAADQGIDVSFTPALSFYDTKSGKEMVVLYKIDSMVCPFLSDSGCLIYQVRPLLCRAFPIITTGSINGEVVRSTSCPSSSLVSSESDPRSAYGDSFLYCALFEDTLALLKVKVNGLIESGAVSYSSEKGKFPIVGVTFQFPDIVDVSSVIDEIDTLEKTRKKFG